MLNDITVLTEKERIDLIELDEPKGAYCAAATASSGVQLAEALIEVIEACLSATQVELAGVDMLVGQPSQSK